MARAAAARAEAPRGKGARAEAPRGKGARAEAPRGKSARAEAPRGRSARGEAPRGRAAHRRSRSGKTAQRAHRRVSGPAPTRGVRAQGGGAAAVALPLPARVLNAPFARAARHRAGGLLDALLTGRAWIALVGVLLAGIVFFNVDLLQRGRDIAKTSERTAQLKRENARLRNDLARLGSSERIQEAAASLGLVLPKPGDVRYLRANPAADARLAAKRITEPVETPIIPAEPVAPAATTTTPTIDPATGLPVTDPTTGVPAATTTTPAATTPTATTPPTTTTPPATTTPAATDPATGAPAAPTGTTTPPTATGQTG
jgi:cell division protein FtsL